MNDDTNPLIDASLALAAICDTDTAELLGEAVFDRMQADGVDFVQMGADLSGSIGGALEELSVTRRDDALKHIDATLRAITGAGISDLALSVDKKLDLNNDKQE